MLNILLSGCMGRMGRAVVSALGEGQRIAAGVDVSGEASFPVYGRICEVEESFDVIVDFSNHALTGDIVDFAVAKGKPCVICTTGQTDEELELIRKASESIPMFRSGNMSLGINLISTLAAEAAKTLGDDFDVEIIEKHHRNKLDAPSGTALMLAEEIKQARDGECEYVYGRADRRMARPKNEIGISSIRGGDIVGEHEVLFCGGGEVISIKHVAESREVFAHGALHAAEYIVGKGAGMYSMKELIKDSVKSKVNA